MGGAGLQKPGQEQDDGRNSGLGGNRVVVLRRLMVCPRKQKLYLPWATPKAETASEGEADKRQFSAQTRRSFCPGLTRRAAGDADKHESPVTGSNAGKVWSFVLCLSHPRDPKNVAPGTLRKA